MVLKLQFKHQKFQEDATRAVVDVFQGQPYNSFSYLADPGNTDRQLEIGETRQRIGWGNYPIIITKESILDHIKTIQRNNFIEPSEKLEGQYNLTIEMETGVGKTYTYIKTIYELHKHYGWSKFIVVVPSIAIREGVNKSFEITKEHFKEEYGEEIISFIYNSQNLSDIKAFESDNKIRVMIINSQAFNSSPKEPKEDKEYRKRIHMRLDEFQSRRPIDAIAKTNPILIIDEPQSVEGEKTKAALQEFNPLFTLRYSATPKDQYNLIYRLDALEAYNKQLVKKIAVIGIEQKGESGSEAFVYFEKINKSTKNPTATIHHYVKTKTGIQIKASICNDGDDLYVKSNNLEAYKNGYVVSSIDARGDQDSLHIGTLTLFAGDVIGKVNENLLRRIQIQETVKAHLEREHQLYNKGIKVLSLFFIDEVAKYKEYSGDSVSPGIYAKIFEEEYKAAVAELQASLENTLGENSYLQYLKAIPADKTHAGYFAKDKKTNHIINSSEKENPGKDQKIADTEAYELIMKDKERLLSLNPKDTPVRFIFSHSALKEGWDNPNVFQICALKQSDSKIRKRQEIGRGMRLCVNQQGIRMDEESCDEKVHDVNILTIIANESYNKFAATLQKEIADNSSNRPLLVDKELFQNKEIRDSNGNVSIIDSKLANSIYNDLVRKYYVDDNNVLTEKYYEDKENGTLEFDNSLKPLESEIVRILDLVYKPIVVENAKGSHNVELKFLETNYKKKEFQELWSRINKKATYHVSFDTDKLIQEAVGHINEQLFVSQPRYEISAGELGNIKSKEALETGIAMERRGSHTVKISDLYATSTKYDLIGKVTDATDLTRKTVGNILKSINAEKFALYKQNPEEFIIKVSNLINEIKAREIIEDITYNVLSDRYTINVFKDHVMKGVEGTSATKILEPPKHLYDRVIYDSENERRFAEELNAHEEVCVYVKLPKKFVIPTPLGNYNPDWAIAFNKGRVKHLYFIAETKGKMSDASLREEEKGKIQCAEKFFKTISDDSIKYHKVDSYETMIQILNSL